MLNVLNKKEKVYGIFLNNIYTQDPCIIGKYFYTASEEKDKIGGMKIDINSAKEYLDCLDAIDLQELTYVGSRYTWWNKRG